MPPSARRRCGDGFPFEPTILGRSFDRQRNGERQHRAHKRLGGRPTLVSTRVGEERGRAGSAGGSVPSGQAHTSPEGTTRAPALLPWRTDVIVLLCTAKSKRGRGKACYIVSAARRHLTDKCRRLFDQIFLGRAPTPALNIFDRDNIYLPLSAPRSIHSTLSSICKKVRLTSGS